MIDKRYYEKLGGFAYLLGELRKKLGREQTDVLVNDAVTLCNELCGKYQGLSKKEKLHTERMIFPRAAIYLQMVKYIPQEESIGLMEESVRIGVEPDRKRLRAVTKLPFIRPLFFKIFRKMIGTMFNGDAGFKFAEIEADSALPGRCSAMPLYEVLQIAGLQRADRHLLPERRPRLREYVRHHV